MMYPNEITIHAKNPEEVPPTTEEGNKFVLGREEAAKKDREILKNMVITDHEYNGREIIIKLRENTCIYLTVHESSVAWELSNVDQVRKIDSVNLPDSIYIMYRDRQMQFEEDFNWNWKSILDGMIGKSVIYFSADQISVSCSIEGYTCLYFYPFYVDGGRRDDFLYFQGVLYGS